MIYEWIKFTHTLSASLLMGSIAYSCYIWHTIRSPQDIFSSTERIQFLTWALILPSALLQFGTGFTMISLKHYSLSALWIDVSAVGFIVVIGSWFGFLYFLMQQMTLLTQRRSREIFTRHKDYRKLQAIMLALCICALLSMIFFMANKIN